MKTTTSASSVQSVDRTLDIIELLSTHPAGMALSDISERTGLHVSTVHRLLSTLTARGFVCKNIDTGKYRLTFRLFELGSRIANQSGVLSVATPFLRQLGIETEETVHLVLRDGDFVTYIYKHDASQSFVRMDSYVGLQNPMYCTGVGKSILARLPESEVASIWSRTPVTQFTATTIVTLAQMHQELEQVRRLGYAMDNEEHEIGVSCIAASICDFTGCPIAAISISAPSARILHFKDTFAPKLMATANEISTILGNIPKANH